MFFIKIYGLFCIVALIEFLDVCVFAGIVYFEFSLTCDFVADITSFGCM